MAFAKKGDVFVPELLAEALPGAFAGMAALSGTGAAVINTSFPGGRAQVGESVKVPYFGTIGELQDLAADGDALTPVGITTSNETATVAHSGIAIEATKWAELSGVSDPYAEMARQIAVSVQRKIDSVLITLANSAFTGVLTSDVYNAGVPVKMDYDQLITAKMKFGDESNDIAHLCVHSATLGDMLRLKETTGRPLLVDPVNASDLPRFGGIPFTVSDRNGVSADSPPKYTSLLLKKGSLVFWMNGTPQVQTDRDILSDTDVAAVHIYYAAHAYKRMPGLTKSGVCRIIHNSTAP